MKLKTLGLHTATAVIAITAGVFIGQNFIPNILNLYDNNESNTAYHEASMIEADNTPDMALLSNDEGKLSYSIGALIAKSIKRQTQQFGDIDYKILLKSIQTVLEDRPTLLEEKEMFETINVAQQKQMAKDNQKNEEMGQTNQQKGDAFLEENKNNKDVVTTKSGLQYKVLTTGKGEKPKETDRVSVHYEGRLLDGTVFDSSYKRDAPTQFRLNQVIKGWTEGLQLMGTGSTWELYIPANLAYGDKAPPSIGPNQTLIFKVELLKILEEEKTK